MPNTFVAIVIYAITMGFMLAVFFMCGTYLIITKHPIGKPDFNPNIPVRKLGGRMLIVLGLLYIYSSRLIAYLPEWGSKDTSLWGMYVQQEALLYMIVCFPLFFLFIFNLVENVKSEHYLTIYIPVIVPLVTYILYRIQPNKLLYAASIFFWVAYIIIMCLLYIRRVRLYEKRIVEQHSNIDNRVLWRFWFPFSMFIFTMLVGMVLSVFEGNAKILIVHIFFNIGCTLTLVWSVDFLEGNVEETPVIEENNSEKEDELDEFTQQRLLAIEAKLQKLLNEQPPFFLTPNLGITDLSLLVGTNRTYLGEYFHRQKTTFYLYINTLRINYACELMSAQKTSLNEIAEKCGFNTTRTFRRVFEDIKGCVPSEWNRKYGGVICCNTASY